MPESISLNNILYLFVYTGALINLFTTLVFKRNSRGILPKGFAFLLVTIALASVFISIQIFLNTVWLPTLGDNLAIERLTFFQNSIIFIILTLMLNSFVISGLSIVPSKEKKQIEIVTMLSSLAILLPLILFQALAIFKKSIVSGQLLGYNLIAFFITFLLFIIFSTFRLFFYKQKKYTKKSINFVRILFISIPAIILIFSLTGSFASGLISPAVFFLLNLYCTIVLYLFKTGKTKKDETAIPENTFKLKELCLDELCKEKGLSKRETEVAILLAKGKSYKEIAAELFISISTTQTHISRIYSKLGVNSKTELANLLYYKK